MTLGLQKSSLGSILLLLFDVIVHLREYYIALAVPASSDFLEDWLHQLSTGQLLSLDASTRHGAETPSS